MATRERLLTLLEGDQGAYLSGEELAGTLGVSRNAVWKAVKTLQREGYAIDAVPNRGYRLSVENDILSPQGIQKYLDDGCRGLCVEVFPRVDSTNALVREKAAAGAPAGYAAVAAAQTAGRGRLGRRFYSPAGTGVYLSLLLRPENCAANRAVRITTMAAVAMCEAIESVSDEKAEIKWVNDIFIAGRKVCGILTEAAFDLESGLLEYAVLGVGVNVCAPDGGFPEELRHIAGAVFRSPQRDIKNRLTGAFLNRFMAIYAHPEDTGYGAAYRRRSLAVGKRVTVVSPDRSRSALVLGVDEECRLLVRYGDGSEEALSTGEISIRL